MNTVNESALNFVKLELEKAQFKILTNKNGREGVDYIIGTNEIYFQSINLDSQRSVKIPKQDLGELKDNLFVTLVLVINKEPKVTYLIPSKQLSQSDNNIFIENEVSLMPCLSNWEIKVSTNTIPELVKYSLENMIDKLKS